MSINEIQLSVPGCQLTVKAKANKGEGMKKIFKIALLLFVTSMTNLSLRAIVLTEKQKQQLQESRARICRKIKLQYRKHKMWNSGYHSRK